jgi:hypothetical protein
MPDNKATQEIRKILELYLKLDAEIIEDLTKRIDSAIDETAFKELKNIQTTVKMISMYPDKKFYENKTPEEAAKEVARHIDSVIEIFSNQFKSFEMRRAEMELQKEKDKSE